MKRPKRKSLKMPGAFIVRIYMEVLAEKVKEASLLIEICQLKLRFTKKEVNKII
jgi:hypothetical protein